MSEIYIWEDFLLIGQLFKHDKSVTRRHNSGEILRFINYPFVVQFLAKGEENL